MSVLEQYRQEAKLLYPAEVQVREINEIREKIKAGENLTAERYKKVFKPVTSKLEQMEEIIQEVANKSQASAIPKSPEWILESPPAVAKKASPIPHATPSSMDRLFNDEFTATVLSKYNLPLPFKSESPINQDMLQDKLEHLKIISKRLGGQKAKAQKSEREEIDKELEVIKKYRHILKVSQGTGLFYYKNAKDLINRLEVLIGQMGAGNDSFDLQNEAIAIIDKLLQEKMICKQDHEKLYEKIYSF